MDIHLSSMLRNISHSRLESGMDPPYGGLFLVKKQFYLRVQKSKVMLDTLNNNI
jgi:hypothetical protein